ncbi:hypothetical protein [Gracilinema caldarium]|uniref:Uncharacterized protein n=1 Tax=Gracilinema caldarium (strain ATCC 51460 / DSM 7334 / H1) TaxID=744872 RepID=F8EZ44_GRAC1|nr:hypothetical protein [Gracilinema caldarium]AEJ19275.1 hypothetical protein Spica_1129 [Gracilinema caldarium DSM 7334]
MEEIKDLSWMSQVALGTLERFEVAGYSVVAVSGSKGATYQYRLLFFEPGAKAPFYAINLEHTILGDVILTEQLGSQHHTLEHLAQPQHYESFRIKALERALSYLSTLKKS